MSPKALVQAEQLWTPHSGESDLESVLLVEVALRRVVLVVTSLVGQGARAELAWVVLEYSALERSSLELQVLGREKLARSLLVSTAVKAVRRFALEAAAIVQRPEPTVSLKVAAQPLSSAPGQPRKAAASTVRPRADH